MSDAINPEDVLIGAEQVSRVFYLGGTSVEALKKVSIVVPEGEMVLVQGKSGSGKTTLLNLIGGLDRPTEGLIRYRGDDIYRFSEGQLTRWRKKAIGFVFQAFALFPGLTALENVDLAGRVAGLPPKEAAEQAARLLGLLGLDKRSGHLTSELSGGEQQRVALSRGLIGNPEIVLADEPTGELDHAMSGRLLAVLRNLVDRENLTVCLTSHDPAVRGFAHRTYTLEDGAVVREDEN